MNKKEIEKLALEYDRNLSNHPMSAVELRKDLTEFAIQVVKKLKIPVVSGSASEQFKELKTAIVEITEQIDKETPWQETEPKWWLEMMDIQAKCR